MCVTPVGRSYPNAFRIPTTASPGKAGTLYPNRRSAATSASICDWDMSHTPCRSLKCCDVPPVTSDCFTRSISGSSFACNQLHRLTRVRSRTKRSISSPSPGYVCAPCTVIRGSRLSAPPGASVSYGMRMSEPATAATTTRTPSPTSHFIHREIVRVVGGPASPEGGHSSSGGGPGTTS